MDSQYFDSITKKNHTFRENMGSIEWKPRPLVNADAFLLTNRGSEALFFRCQVSGVRCQVSGTMVQNK
jgi:hypothetical protein